MSVIIFSVMSQILLYTQSFKKIPVYSSALEEDKYIYKTVGQSDFLSAYIISYGPNSSLYPNESFLVIEINNANESIFSSIENLEIIVDDKVIPLILDNSYIINKTNLQEDKHSLLKDPNTISFSQVTSPFYKPYQKDYYKILLSIEKAKIVGVRSKSLEGNWEGIILDKNQKKALSQVIKPYYQKFSKIL